MKTKLRSALLGAALSLGLGLTPGCGTAPPPTDGADTVFLDAKVYTMNPARPWAEALAVRGNRIVYVGNNAGARALIDEHSLVIDATGRMLLPGFVSANDHLIASNWTLAGVDLSAAEDKAECLRMIEEYAASHPDDKVIHGVGWTRQMLGGQDPTAQELDQAVPDRPAILLDATTHDAWLNSAALTAGGIDKDSADAQPGTSYWLRDDEDNPTGTAIEYQWMPTYLATGAWDPQQAMRASTLELFGLAAANGTTTLQNPGIITPNLLDPKGMSRDFQAAMAMLEKLDAEGMMSLRVQALPVIRSADEDPRAFVEFGAKMKRSHASDRLRVRAIKIQPEGTWTSYGARFLSPYQDRDSSGNFGLEPEALQAITLSANGAGLDVVIDSHGDASARAAVDAFAAARDNGYTDARNAIHHLTWVHPDDYQRIVDLKIPVNSTPSASTDREGSDKQALRMLGRGRVRSEMGRYPDLARDGVTVSIAANLPSTMPSMQSPLYVVEVAVTMMEPSDIGTRPHPANRRGMTVDQALRAVTIDAAWQLRMEDKIGSLEVGKYADIAVIEESLFNVHPLDIEELQVIATMMDGEFTHMVADQLRAIEIHPDDL